MIDTKKKKRKIEDTDDTSFSSSEQKTNRKQKRKKTEKFPNEESKSSASMPPSQPSTRRPVHPSTQIPLGVRIAPATISVALPGSIADNAQSRELRTYLVGQIARALCVFNISEIIIFRDQESAVEEEKTQSGMTRDPCLFMGRVLEYLETPQYLRKALFPICHDLQYAGLLNPLDAPHHLRIDEDSGYREGIILNRPTRKGHGSQVDIGLRGSCTLSKILETGVRVTVELEKAQGSAHRKKQRGRAVPPTEPRRKGIYWGYTTRICNTMSEIWTQCPYETGYDLSIGTSERGRDITDHNFTVPSCNHLLIVMGGLAGLESCLTADYALKTDDPEELFDLYLNVCPNQGSRTIRTEEALLLVLSSLQAHVDFRPHMNTEMSIPLGF